MRVFQVIPYFVPPRSIHTIGFAWIQDLGRLITGSNRITGSDGLYTEQLRNLGTGQDATKRVGRFWHGLIFRKAAPILNATELFWFHARTVGNFVHFLHAFIGEFRSATVNESPFVGILTRLSVVINEFELFILTQLVLTNDIPILPEF